MTDLEQLDAKTLAEMTELADRYPQARSALLPMLHLVQSAQGQITQAGIQACADALELTEAEVSAVATFYTMYKRRPMGKHHVGVCTNTLCAVMGRSPLCAPGRRQRRDERRWPDHVGKGRVQRGLRFRAGDDGQLGVLRQPDARVGDRGS